MSVGRKKLVWMLGLAGCGLVVVFFWLQPWRKPAPAADKDFPLPPFSLTRFLNTGPDASYIGVTGCAECHDRQHQSYLHTAHSRALGDVVLDDEPADAAFFHELSGRSYRVYRQDNALRHEEIVRSPDGKEIARVDLPIRYRIGSGNFTRSYIVEVDGFLHQSPITWYASKKKWDVSPGYDLPEHHAFERRVTVECLSCHAGRVEPVADSIHRLNVLEQVIGCESCHGPGALHRDRRRSRKFAANEDDWSIVNPGKLSRPLLESLCSTCHLSGAASVLLRGRGPTDFRPGRPLTDYRTDYRLDSGSEQMTVVGHMEQLRRSVCYQKSSDMTCLTCHDPHARDKPKNPVAFYRQKCLDCHAGKGCALDRAQRLAQDAADNCIACHMPRGDTEIPHIAFTHHRVGRHPAPARPDDGRVPELVPTDDISHVPPLDRQRNLGMAYVSASHDQAYQRYGQVFRRRGLELLEAVRAAGLRNDDSTAALIELYQEYDRDRAIEVAREVVAAPGIAGHLRANVRLFLAYAEMDESNFAAAQRLLEDSTRVRRYADDWRLLGAAHFEQNEPNKALAALQQALTIRPDRPRIHVTLAQIYRRLGDAALAQEHDERARLLFKYMRD